MDKKVYSLVGEALKEIVESARYGGKRARVGLLSTGSELGEKELLKGAIMAKNRWNIDVVMIGPKTDETSDLSWIETENSENAIHRALDEALESKEIESAVALHYPFPLGVATVGLVITPAYGKEMFIATSTGTSDTDRVKAMVLNAIYGIAVAKACGIKEPTVGILNIDGAKTVNKALEELKANGYDIVFGESARKDGGAILRGNDILAGVVDICVCDTLTGNVLMKLFSAYTTGGMYESLGYGYGPSVGVGYDKTINIISRASGASVIANSIYYSALASRGNLQAVFKEEYEKAVKAGLDKVLKKHSVKPVAVEEVKMPEKEPVSEEIGGIDVFVIEDAVKVLWKRGIYAESAMGCTGPVIKVASDKLEAAIKILKEAGYI